jgi:hypothetical protein
MTTRAKTFTALAAIATLGLTAFTTAQPAQAHQHNGHHHHHQTRRRGHSARRSGHHCGATAATGPVSACGMARLE